MNRTLDSILFLSLIILISGSITMIRDEGSMCFAASPAINQDKTHIKFEEKLDYYLDLKTQNVVEELVAREAQLLQLVNNVHRELELRGQSAIPAFKTVYAEKDSLIEEYSEELSAFLQIYDDLEHLEKIATYGEDIEALENIQNTRDLVANNLSDREVYKKGIYTSERVGRMVDEYTFELDTLLNIYDVLEVIEGRAIARNDQELLTNVREEKTRLFKVLSQWGKLGPITEEDFIRYRLEMQAVQKVSKDIDETVQSKQSPQAQELLQVKRNLINQLDKSVYGLLADSGYKKQNYPTVSQFVDTWKDERLVDIKTRLTEYRVIRNGMLNNSNDVERKRMLVNEIQDAFLNYSDELYRTAQYQLIDIIQTYSPDNISFTPLYFYIAECHYHQNEFQSARNYYLKVLQSPVPSSYTVETWVRMMQYAQDFAGSKEFFEHYGQVIAHDSLASKALLSYAHFLAANKYFDNSQYFKARDVLLKIDNTSNFYLPAQLLLGVTYTNLDDYDSAIPIFEKLSDKNSYPWTGLNTAFIRNTAIIRLGMLYYQKGQFIRATSTFNKVSKGFEGFDKALIGQAWSQLQLENYDNAIFKSYDLLKNYLASNFTYEALVLSAHCQRLMDKPEDALTAYRYVVRANEHMSKQKEFNRERERTFDQIRQLDRMEQQALETQQEDAYSKIAQIRNELNEFLLRTREKGDTGSRLIEDYYDERVDILEHLRQLDDVVTWAESEGRNQIVKRAMIQRARLIKVLETFQADRQVVNTAYLVEFPLAAKEAGDLYKREQLSSVYQNLDLEKKRIENALDSMNDLEADIDTRVPFSSQVDMEILKNDLQALENRLGQIRKWMNKSIPDQPQSDIDYWSDFSGFEMSDIIYQAREQKLEKIDLYADRLETIETVLTHRQQTLQEKLEQFEEDIKSLQQRLLSRKIELEQMEKQTYFEKFYFDTSLREEEDWEHRLRELLER